MESPIKNTSRGVFFVLPLDFDSVAVEWNLTRQFIFRKKEKYFNGGCKENLDFYRKGNRGYKNLIENQSAM